MNTSSETSRPSVIVSVVVVNYELSPFINRLIESLKIQDIAHEVIVSDNPTPANDWENINSYARVVRNSVNLGYGKGCNSGAAAASPESQFVCILNPDTVVPAGMLRKWVESYRANLPAGGILAPRLLNDNGTVQQSTYKFISGTRYWTNHSLFSAYLKEAKKGNFFGGTAKGHADIADLPADSPPAEPHAPFAIEPIEWAMGAAYLLDRASWDKLGGFNPAFFQYAEDQDLCWRAHHAGMPVLLDSAVRIYHSQGDPTPEERGKGIIRLYSSLKRFVSINYSFMPRFTVQISVLADMLLRIVIMAPFWFVKKNNLLFKNRFHAYIQTFTLWAKPKEKNPPSIGLE